MTLPVNTNAHKLLIMSARITNSLGGMLGSYNPLLLIVIIRTVNVPQIKETNKLKAQISPAVQTIRLATPHRSIQASHTTQIYTL